MIAVFMLEQAYYQSIITFQARKSFQFNPREFNMVLKIGQSADFEMKSLKTQ